MTTNPKPAAKVSFHPINAAIWQNERGDGNTFYSVTFERAYKDDAGKWQSTNSFNAGDLLLLAKVADRAHSEIYKLRAADRMAEKIDE